MPCSRPDRGPPRRGPSAARPRRAAGLVALAALLLAGCSAISLAWGYLDAVLANRVDHWVDLSPEQRRRLEQRLQPWLEQVAAERTPAYAGFLRDLAARSRAGLDDADARWAHRQLRRHYGRLVADAADWLAPALADLDDRQLEHLGARMRDANAGYRARYLDVSRREGRRALAERLIGVVERWTGRLDRDQERLVHAGVAELPDVSRQWYDYRLRMQAGLLALARSGAGEPAIRAHLIGWWADGAGTSPGEALAFEDYEHRVVALLGRLARTLSPRQRAAVADRLHDLAEGLDAIGRDARVAANDVS